MDRLPPPSRLGDVPSLRDAVRATGGRREVKASRLPIVALLLLMVASAAVVVVGLRPPMVEAMPLPEQTFEISSQEAAQAVWNKERPVASPAPVAQVEPARDVDEVAASAVPKQESPSAHPGPDFSIASMEPGSIWIPSLDGYAPAIGSAQFRDSLYPGLQTLWIPDEPTKAVWFSDGAPMAGGSEGTTLISSHASTLKNPGVFRTLHQVQPGAKIWTRAPNGSWQAWAVTKLWVADHEQFPQEYFAADGDRQLVVTTCGGRLNSRGYYAQNIFAVASPVGEPIG